MRAFLALPRHHRARQRRLAGQLAIDLRLPLDASRARPERQHVHLDPQLIARRHRPAKLGPLNPREHHQLCIAIFNLGIMMMPPACAIASTTSTPGMMG